jgi:hypothetical protein
MPIQRIDYSENEVTVHCQLQSKPQKTIKIPFGVISGLPSLSDMLKHSSSEWHVRQTIEYVAVPEYGGKIALVFDCVAENQYEQALEEDVFGPYFVKYNM